MRENGSRMTQKWVVGRMREVLTQAGLKGNDFSGISLRRGGSTDFIESRSDRQGYNEYGKMDILYF